MWTQDEFLHENHVFDDFGDGPSVRRKSSAVSIFPPGFAVHILRRFVVYRITCLTITGGSFRLNRDGGVCRSFGSP
jgi:hypothetical protein